MNTLVSELLNEYERIFIKVTEKDSPKRTYAGSESLITEYKAIADKSSADDFFGKYGIGNRLEGIDNPFERQLGYELLLKILKLNDPIQYEEIHKGTPYYFIGWTTFQYRDFSKAIFYMDAAVSEDLKFPDVINRTKTRLSLDFFLLNNQDKNSSFFSVHTFLIDVVKKTLQRFTSDGGGIILVNEFRDKFVKDLLYSGSQERSLLTALYTFLLEYQEIQKQIDLRSNTGGSIQPFLDHLFGGARILESLLEKKGSVGDTLRPKIQNTTQLAVSPSVLKSKQTLVDAEQVYNRLVASGNSFQDCNFACSFIIRNTTGHSLLWRDQFISGNSYKQLYNSLINSVFWTIEKLWM